VNNLKVEVATFFLIYSKGKQKVKSVWEAKAFFNKKENRDFL